MSFAFKHITDSSFVFETQQLDYSACQFMQHVFVLFAFKAFFFPLG